MKIESISVMIDKSLGLRWAAPLKQAVKVKDRYAYFHRYMLFQIPGWLIAALVLIGFREWTGLSLQAAIGIFSLWVAVDFALYPFLRKSYERDVRTGSERLIGKRGTASEWLRPRGYIEVHGQLWRAVAEPQDHPIAPKTPVRIVSANGLTLTVTQHQHR